MKALATSSSFGLLFLVTALGIVSAQDQPTQEARRAEEGRPAVSPERESDVKAITELLASFIRAYNAKDAKAIGEMFTPDAEIEDEGGEIIHGRDAIVDRFAATFAEGAGTLELETDSLRFLGADLAIEEGVASISTAPGAPPRANNYSAIYARQGGRWLQARIRDEPSEGVTPNEQLRELGWMLGDWINESDDAVVLTTCKWSDDGKYLLRTFDVKIEGRIALSGTQRIGWDAQRGQFRTWVFDDEGGFAEGLIARGDDRWVIKGTGVRSDGQSVSFTTALTPLGKDRIRWEVLDRTVGGEALQDAERFELVRRAPTPEK